MSFEINLIAVDQQRPIHLNSGNRVLLHNEIEHDEVNRYAEIWPFFSNTKGILYSLVEEVNEEYYSSFTLCDSDFQVSRSEKAVPIWISKEAKENLTPFIIKDDLYEEIMNVIKYVLECSPHKRILFQTRYQGGDSEIILGIIKFNKFKELLEQKQVLFNVCYIIESD